MEFNDLPEEARKRLFPAIKNLEAILKSLNQDDIKSVHNAIKTSLERIYEHKSHINSLRYGLRSKGISYEEAQKLSDFEVKLETYPYLKPLNQIFNGDDKLLSIKRAKHFLMKLYTEDKKNTEGLEGIEVFAKTRIIKSNLYGAAKYLKMYARDEITLDELKDKLVPLPFTISKKKAERMKVSMDRMSQEFAEEAERRSHNGITFPDDTIYRIRV